MRSTLPLFLFLLSAGPIGVVVASAPSSSQLLSIPENDHNTTERDAEILAVASLISTQPRFQIVNGVEFPLPPGPIPVNGSLAQQIVFQELELANLHSNPNVPAIGEAAATANITSIADYLSFYLSLQQHNLIVAPLTALDFSDKSFGEDRLTIKGFRLRQVRRMVKPSIPLSPAQLNSVCGSFSLKQLIQEKRLYVEDLAFASKYNDPTRPYKFVPSINGFFCVNGKKQFLPMAIHITDTNLIYTPFDKTNEWILAKMALNAAGLNVQQFDHFLVSHMMLEPIRVELLRAVSSHHPVYVLMEHHFLQLFGNTILGLDVLLSANTTVDFTFGWGATGSLRFLYDESQNFDFTKQFFINSIQTRGLDDIPNAKLFTDSRNVFRAIRDFVKDFVMVYYSGHNDVGLGPAHESRPPRSLRGGGGPMAGADAAIAGDPEMQHWFEASSKIVPGFPSKVTSVDGLVDTLSNLIFRTSVLHHAMNSDVLWHTISFPYSLPALFAPLPTTKGQATIKLTDYITPTRLLAPLTTLIASFVRPIRPVISILHSYEQLAFNVTARQAIETFEACLQHMESEIAARERNNSCPDTFLKPSR